MQSALYVENILTCCTSPCSVALSGIVRQSATCEHAHLLISAGVCAFIYRRVLHGSLFGQAAQRGELFIRIHKITHSMIPLEGNHGVCAALHMAKPPVVIECHVEGLHHRSHHGICTDRHDVSERLHLCMHAQRDAGNHYACAALDATLALVITECHVGAFVIAPSMEPAQERFCQMLCSHASGHSAIPLKSAHFVCAALHMIRGACRCRRQGGKPSSLLLP